MGRRRPSISQQLPVDQPGAPWRQMGHYQPVHGHWPGKCGCTPRRQGYSGGNRSGSQQRRCRGGPQAGLQALPGHGSAPPGPSIAVPALRQASILFQRASRHACALSAAPRSASTRQPRGVRATAAQETGHCRTQVYDSMARSFRRISRRSGFQHQRQPSAQAGLQPFLLPAPEGPAGTFSQTSSRPQYPNGRGHLPGAVHGLSRQEEARAAARPAQGPVACSRNEAKTRSRMYPAPCQAACTP